MDIIAYCQTEEHNINCDEYFQIDMRCCLNALNILVVFLQNS